MLLVAGAALSMYCASAGHRSAHRTDYDDCFHTARRGVPEGWLCTDDGQITGATFSGHVVYQDVSGSLPPVSDVEFWQGWGERAAIEGRSTRLDIEVASDGWFSYRQLVTYTEGWRKRDGQIEVTQKLGDVVFVLRAPGCKDYIVHFRPDDPEYVILMDCDARVKQEAETRQPS